jgi:BirA family biotin operon repressor/biotin-[acetyl-CoA-carboxylase] ligase
MRFPVLHVSELDSTNSEAARRAGAGEGGPLWITTDRQTVGRGRLGRVWQGGDGNLAATLLLSTNKPPAIAAQIAYVAALAATQMTQAFVPGERVTLKWPNDVLISGAKACGVLVETGAFPGGGLWLAVGIGANLASAPSDTSYPATRFSAHGQNPSVETALSALDSAFGYWLDVWNEKGFEPLRAAWTRHAHGLGQPARASICQETIEGVIAGLDVDGALILRIPQGTVRRITAGDVIFGTA